MQVYENKALRLLKSRKFWAAVAAASAVAEGYFTGSITGWQAEISLVTIASSYTIGTAIEDSGNNQVPPVSPKPPAP